MIENMVCDGHCDTVLDILNRNRRIGKLSQHGHLDIPRLKRGGVNVQVFAVYIEKEYKPSKSLQRALQLIDAFLFELSENKDNIQLATSHEQIESIVSKGKIAAILAVEGGEAIEGTLSYLRTFYRLGVRMMTLTWNQRNKIADGSDYYHSTRGLTSFGKRVIREMNRLGMIIDISHISESGFWDVLYNSNDPVIASHSNCYQLCPHQRNLKDSQIRAIAEKGGLVCITYVPDFLIKEDRKAVLDDVIEHIDYVLDLVGSDYVGLGSDFDGCRELPVGLEGADKICQLRDRLIEKGYAKEDVQKIMGYNFLNLFQQVTQASTG